MSLSDQMMRAITGWTMPYIYIGYNMIETFNSELTLITNALIKAAGSRSLYVFVTKHPPTIVAALLANVNYIYYVNIIQYVNKDTLKNHKTGSVIWKNWRGMFWGEEYLEMNSNPIRKKPKALAKASKCF